MHTPKMTNVSLGRRSLDELYDSLDIKLDLTTMNLDLLNTLTFTAFQNNVVSIIPRCLCGEVEGSIHMGELCISCNTPVSDYLGKYSPILWISHPTNKKIFVAPQFWSMLNSTIKQSKFDSLAYLTNSRYKSTIMTPKVLNNMLKDIKGFQRSYTWVVENLETILLYLINSPDTYSKRAKFRELLSIYTDNKHVILSSKLPLPSKNLFLIEDSSFSTKKTNLVTGVVKSLALNYRDAVDSNRDLNIAMSRLVSELSTVYDMNIVDLIAGKKRVIRSNIFGTKVPGSFRTVMLPITGPHNYDDFHMPWIEGIICFRPYLINRLTKLGYRYVDICIMLDVALYNFNQEISDIMDSLIAEAKVRNGKGICISMGRNPTQHRFSIIPVFIVKIKKDPLDFTSEYSMLLCPSFNGD